MKKLAAAIATLALLSCTMQQGPSAPQVHLKEVAVRFPSAVRVYSPAVFQQGSCFASAEGPMCLTNDSLNPLLGLEQGVESVGRNARGLVLLGNWPLRLVEPDGEAHLCAPLPRHPFFGDRWALDRAWLSVDESRFVVVTGGTEWEAASWISYDDCQTWEQLNVVGALVGVYATAKQILGVVSHKGELHSFTFEIDTRASHQTRFEHNHTRVAIDEKGFLAFGQGVTRYTEAGATAGVTLAGLQTVAGCDPEPTVAVARVGDRWELAAYGADGARWWGMVVGRSLPLEAGSICTGNRLFLSLAGVILEVRRDGLRPLESDSISSRTERAMLSPERIQYFTSDESSTAVARLSWEGTHWNWDGVGTSSDPSSLDGIALGEFVLEIRYGFLDSPGLVGYTVKTTGQDKWLAELPLKIDTGLRRLPTFRQINTPRPGMVFYGASCYVVTTDQSGSQLGGWPCDPSGNLQFNADVVADPDVEGRWLVHSVGGNRSTLLVEGFGERVTSLGRAGVFVFDQNGEPLHVADAYMAASLADRQGYWFSSSSDVKLQLFDGRSWNWPDSRLLGASGNKTLIQQPHSLLSIMATTR